MGQLIDRTLDPRLFFAANQIGGFFVGTAPRHFELNFSGNNFAKSLNSN